MKTKNDLQPDEITLVKLAQDYANKADARQLMEKILWPDGPVCPHCKSKDVYRLKHRENTTTRPGLLKCSSCRKQFTITVGTILEGSHLPISTWLMAIFLMCSSKKGMSAHQIHRMLGVTYKTAWFLCHRIRFAIGKGPLAEMLKGTVECDETFVGGKPRVGDKLAKEGHRGGYRKDSSKVPVVALIQRDGDVRTQVVASVSQKNLRQFVETNIDKKSTIQTDQFGMYRTLFYPWKEHQVVNHSAGEYARKNPDGSVSHVNNCESFFSLIKRGVYGAFHHVSPEHLPRYCDEFSFRWNNRKVSDGQRMTTALAMTVGKRLTYREVV